MTEYQAAIAAMLYGALGEWHRKLLLDLDEKCLKEVMEQLRILDRGYRQLKVDIERVYDDEG